MTNQVSRRSFLSGSAVLGCSLAASPLLTPVSFAAAPWDTRLVVIILRGGMDALDVVQPYGDPGFAKARTTLNYGTGRKTRDLDGFFALHPALAPLMPLWRREELGFVHAVSTPYRDKRSHFDGQDLLEAGTVSLGGGTRDGWLNRLLQHLPGTEARTAFALGRGDIRVLDGAAPVSDWSPEANIVMSPQAERLAGMIMQDDPLFHAAFNEALDLSRDDSAEVIAGNAALAEEGTMDMMAMPAGKRGKQHKQIAAYAAEQLRGDTRIASFSINGWDTHSRQQVGLTDALGRLSDTILTIRDGVGAGVWEKTAIVAMTEFGRTVRENGTKGTDHGTGGAMLLAGGAIRGGRVAGRWPGLDEADLYDRRDLMPTGDVRASAAWILAGLTGVDRAVLERSVFPDLDMGDDPGLLR